MKSRRLPQLGEKLIVRNRTKDAGNNFDENFAIRMVDRGFDFRQNVLPIVI